MTRHAKPQLTRSRLDAGVWKGVLIDAGKDPVVQASHQGRVLPGLAVTALADGRHEVRVPLPADLLADGVQTVLLTAGGEGAGRLVIVAGAALEEDVQAEIAVLRAELDLLKRAFQRQFRK